MGEIPLRYNPYLRDQKNGLPYLVTSAEIKKEAARSFGLPCVRDGIFELIDHGEVENRTQEKAAKDSRSHPAIMPPFREANSPFLPLEIATDKARHAANEIILKQLPLTSIVALDSTWATDATPENLTDLPESVRLIQKPKDKIGVELILTHLKERAKKGETLQSLSGICEVRILDRGFLEFNQSLIIVDHGKLNPNANWDMLLNMLRVNHHYAGGFSSIDLYSSSLGLVVPNEFVRVMVLNGGLRSNDRIPPLGSFIRRSSLFEISPDPANWPQIVALSLGIIPQSSSSNTIIIR
jgi:hypothetical protein